MITKKLLRDLDKWLNEQSRNAYQIYAFLGAFLGCMVTSAVVASRFGVGWVLLAIPLGAITGAMLLTLATILINWIVNFVAYIVISWYKRLPEGDEPVSEEELQTQKQQERLEEIRKRNNWRA